MGRMKTYSLATLGCKVNQYESEQIRALLDSLGLMAAAPGHRADLAVVNTCAVTGEACKKTRQLVRKAARTAETVLVVGCYATEQPQRLLSIPKVAACVGHDSDILSEIGRFVSERMAAADSDHGTVAPVIGCSSRVVSAGTTGVQPDRAIYKAASTQPQNRPPVHFAHRQRAFLKVQDGCDAFCSYCIIPKLRRQLRSKPLADVRAEAARLVASGHREIVLTGIFLGAYGRATAVRKRWPDGNGPAPLVRLVEALSAIPGLKRLRLSSLEPGDLTDDLLAAMAASEVCVPHLHLPLQSGSPAVLKRMGRQYTLRQFLKAVDRAYRYLDRPAITTDVIVGFPGETDEDFQRTCRIAEQVGFLKMHVFGFSPKPGTAAARWGRMFVPGRIVKERIRALLALEEDLSQRFRRQFVGETERIIPEPPDRRAEPYAETGQVELHGRADRYFPVAVRVPAANADELVGRVVPVRIIRAEAECTLGVLAPAASCQSLRRKVGSTE